MNTDYSLLPGASSFREPVHQETALPLPSRLPVQRAANADTPTKPRAQPTRPVAHHAPARPKQLRASMTYEGQLPMPTPDAVMLPRGIVPVGQLQTMGAATEHNETPLPLPGRLPVPERPALVNPFAGGGDVIHGYPAANAQHVETALSLPNPFARPRVNTVVPLAAGLTQHGETALPLPGRK
jgi:hypothetical protein